MTHNAKVILISIVFSLICGVGVLLVTPSRQSKEPLAEVPEVVRAPVSKSISIERLGTFVSDRSDCEAVMWRANESQHTVMICTSYNGGVSVTQIH